MLNTLLTAALENMSKADEVALDIDGRVLNGMTDPGLSSQMNHRIGLMDYKQICDPCSLLKIELYESPMTMKSLY